MVDDLSALETTVEFYRHGVENARQALERAQSLLAGTERDLQIAENFLEIERRRFATDGSTPFGGMSLKDACVSIVLSKGRATAKEIVDALVKGGFVLETEYPGRAIHTALMHAKDVRKIGPSIYESEQGRLI